VLAALMRGITTSYTDGDAVETTTGMSTLLG
jgi:hypothetical protein